MSSFLVAGSIAYDTLLSYDGSFADGIDACNLEKLSVGYVTSHLVRHYGGTAANIAWNLALLNQSVRIAGSVGNDGASYLERLRSHGIDVSLVQVAKHHVTPTAIIATDTGERQITFFHPGADSDTKPPDVSLLAEKVSYAIVSPHSAVSMLQTAMACSEHGIPYIFDPGQQSLQFSHDDLMRIVEGSFGVIANAYEWLLLRDKLGWSVNDTLHYPGLLVVTQGEHGLNLQTPGASVTVETVTASNFVNPTGAGDALRAGLLTGLSLGWEPVKAAQLGASVASFVVETEGTQLEHLDLDLVYKRIEATYEEPCDRF